MLEALQDIEIASQLAGFRASSVSSLDESYKRLRCDIIPIPCDSEDYQLIEKYLHKTHAPTHRVDELPLHLSPSFMSMFFLTIF